jgi:hypothetical protein
MLGVAYFELSPGDTQLGFRFSKKARNPSCPSGLTRNVAMISAVYLLAVS